MASGIKEFIEREVDKAEFRALYLEYIDVLSAQDLPVIFELAHFSKLVGFDLHVVAAMVHSTETFYRRFEIPKSSGGVRVIEAPLPSLLSVQRWILQNILKKLEINGAAHGFVRGRSIVTNASAHIGGKDLFKCDIKEFFPSVLIARVAAIFKSFGYSPTVSAFLARICTLRGSLPQGGATSPALSNVTLRRMDRRLLALAGEAGLVYTRYADDLNFSGDCISWSFGRLVRKIAQEEGFELNDAKTRRIGAKSKKLITGLVVKKDGLSLPRTTKREIRQQVHRIIKDGAISESERYGDLLYVDRVVGRLSFWRQVEPNHPFVLKNWDAIRQIQFG